MRVELLALGLAFVSVVAAPERVTTPEEAVCSWVKTQWLLDIRSERAILMVATEEWWYAPYADMPFYNPEDVQIAAQARYPRPPDSTVYRAQRFVVAAAGSAHDLDAGASLWVVPLEGCLSTGGHGPLQREEWIPGGDTVTFLLDPRAVGAGPDGSPLFRQHVQFGPHPGADEARGSSELSGTQYFGFVHALPSSQVLASDPRTALEALETWLASENVDSTSYPVKQTLEDLRRERELRPIFWGGYPTLVGCYELGMGPTPPIHPLLARIERLVYLSEVPVQRGVFGERAEFVARPAPREQASDYTSLTWSATADRLSVVWRRENGLVLASFEVDHAAPASVLNGRVRAYPGAVYAGIPVSPAAEATVGATFTRVPCDPASR